MSNPRVQVQGLGPAPTVQPVNLPSFQYGIAQPQAGTNNLLKLAGNLEQFGKITKGYASLVQQESARDLQLQQAQAIQQQEEQREQDKFNEILIKKQINQMAIPNLEGKGSEFLNVENFTNRGAVSQGVDEAINSEWESYVESLGGDVANSLASKAMWNAVTSKYKQDILGKYEAARSAFILNEKTNDISATLGSMYAGNQIVATADVKAVISNYDKLLAKDLGVSKQERSAILIEAVRQQAARLDADKKYDAAFRLLDGVEGINLNGAPVFKGPKALASLTPIRDQVVGKIDSVATQSSAEKRGVLKGRLLSVLASNPIRFEDMPESKIKTLKAALSTLDPDMDDEEMLTKIQQAFEGPGDFGQNLGNILEDIANESDLAAKLYFRIKADILSQWQAIKESGVTPMQKTDENIAEALQGLERYAADNPEDPAPWKGYISEQGGRVPKFDELLERSEELAAGVYVLNKDYYKTAGTALRERLKTAEEITKGIPTVTSGSHFPYALSYIKEELRKKAKTIANEDPEVRDAKLEELQRTLIERETKRFEGMAQASTVDFKKTPVIELAGEQAKTMQQKYPTMRPMGERPQFFRRELAVDRQKMVEDSDLLELGLSLTRYGFTSFDPESWKLIEKAGVGIDAADVRLFSHRAEFNNKVEEWKEIVRKDAIRQALTEEEKEQRDIYNGFGIYNEATLSDFEDAQSIYYR